MSLFSKVLIANRGEIAVRIAGACRALGIKSIGVYSAADRTALHVRTCDEAYHIGPSPAAESYLQVEKLLDVAKKAGCEAVHPGYGFLSENAAFAQAVMDAGLAWIGPPPSAIVLMGSKIESKRLAEANGVPIVPGYFGDDQSLDRLSQEAEKIGYPLLIKASAGGGGKGMRIVNAPGELEAGLDGAGREALAAFGDSSVMLEKYLTRPRHIEVQVIGDKHGTLLHLGERECSIQRRHQKVAEESPSPAISPETRESITASALALAKAAGYENAGTVEFIYQDGKYYFLEMNTRIQVEHPVTEEALEVDIVQMQIRIAAGEPLELKQEEVQFKEHALEVRLYAEDPERGFLPSTGTLKKLRLPNRLAGVRVDAGVSQADVVSPFYDPMIAKIITWGATRDASLLTMQEALGYTQVEGVSTNLEFLRWLVAEPQFRAGDLSTRFIEEFYEPGMRATVPPEVAVGAALALLAAPKAEPESISVWHATPWRQARQDIPLSLVIDGRTYNVLLSEAAQKRGHWQSQVLDGENVLYDGAVTVTWERQDGYSTSWLDTSRLELDFAGGMGRQRITLDHTISLVIKPYRVEVDAGGRSYWVSPAPALSTETLATAIHLKDEDSLDSPMPGKVLKVMVSPGDAVIDGQPLVIIEAMKMEFTVKAPHDGKVEKVKYAVGDQVAVGDILVELEKPGTEDVKRET